MSDSRPDGTSEKPLGADEASVDELTLARERLAFYTSFDSVIQDNIRRSGELLRLVADERERNERELLAMRQEVGRRLATQQQVLTALAASLDAMQGSLAAITEQVGAAIAQLDPDQTPTLAPRVEREASAADRAAVPSEARIVEQDPDIIDPSPSEVSPGSGAVEPGLPSAVPFRSGTDQAATKLPALTPGDLSPTTITETDAADRAAVEVLTHEVETPYHPPDLVPDSDEVSTPERDDAGAAVRRFDLIIRGVPRAAAALSIQRYLQDQSTIRAVEVREYVAGVLRFQIDAAAIDVEALTGWAERGTALVLATGEQVVELQYPETRPDDEP